MLKNKFIFILFLGFYKFIQVQSKLSPEKESACLEIFFREEINCLETHSVEASRNDTSNRLLLTPYIEKGEVELAKTLAAVDMMEILKKGGKTYSGYITVNKEYESNLWFWYFPVHGNEIEKFPFIIWLEGGPGGSFLKRLFDPMGPFILDPNETIFIENPESWINNHSVLYIDNPVGTGFSYTHSNDGFATDQNQISKELLTFLLQFYELFPELHQTSLYIMGSSYGGKHVTSLAYELHQKITLSQTNIKLKGLAIGAGWVDPINLLRVSEVVYHAGLVDDDTAEKLKTSEDDVERQILKGDFRTAMVMYQINYRLLYFTSKIPSFYNINLERPITKTIDQKQIRFMNQQHIRKKIHLGNSTYTNDDDCILCYLLDDMMKSEMPKLEVLLDNYRVLVFSGQNDIIVPYTASVKSYRKMKWIGSKQYMKAEREAWIFEEKVAGYIKKAGNFTEAFLRNSGHFPQYDQPRRLIRLLSYFTHNLSYNTNDSCFYG